MEEIHFENERITNFQCHVTLTLTLDLAILHTVVHHSSTSTYTPNFNQIGEIFCGRAYVHTDGETLRAALLGQLLTQKSPPKMGCLNKSVCTCVVNFCAIH